MADIGIKILGTFEIAKLQLGPGDTLVIKTDRPLSTDHADRIRRHIAPRLPEGIRILVIDPNVQLSVLTRTEIEARAA